MRNLILSAGSRLLICSLIFFVSCQKIHWLDHFTKNNHGHLKQTKTYPSDVVLKWMNLQYRIFFQPQEQSTGVRILVTRFYAYCGIALYESVVPGMPAYQSLSGQLSDMPSVPVTEPGMAYHWPTCANAVMGYMNKNFLPITSAANKAAMDSLENALNAVYQDEVNAPTFQRSVEFGKAVAQLIFHWANTDGFLTVNPPYVPLVGQGLWVPPPTNFASPPPGVPYYGNLRRLMPGVQNENSPSAPMEYSTDPSSAFFNSMKEVYDASLALTPGQQLQANYWRGPMGGAVALWVAILRKVLIEQGNAAMLDKAAMAYCKMGIALQDGAISCFKAQYKYNQLTPITYIRNVMGHSTWDALFPTPFNPGYPEILSSAYAASAAVLSLEFGNNYQFNTNGTHHLGLPGYSFNSFEEAAIHAGLSRFYAGISTKPSIEAGKWIGKKTVEYMDKKIKFKK